ncbi:hypothetical protein IGI04_030117 [Brassica rapa subsp. trilocularis]|uniref:Uncharacterized protein n=1 Tax=Brassica rapa subsp. trilocularis TaxID=1813537 RepID=A0ABQ7LPS3_BRACM|nr:hypothetical protein IGI04_030117 [Brassica rapa subsp. trilocularis]
MRDYWTAQSITRCGGVEQEEDEGEEDQEEIDAIELQKECFRHCTRTNFGNLQYVSVVQSKLPKKFKKSLEKMGLQSMKNTLITYIQKNHRQQISRFLKLLTSGRSRNLQLLRRITIITKFLLSYIKTVIAVMMMTLGGRRHKTNYSSENGEELEMLKFHMSTSAKYLLIVAILLKKSSRANA